MQLPAHIDMKKALGITVALSISGFMILGAYVFSGPSFFTIQHADAEDTKKLLEAYAAKDTDTDGLPDWQEALYGTNPQDEHSVTASLTDGEAVRQGLVKPKFESAPVATTTDIRTIPGVTAASSTLTDQFSKQLFQQYIQSTGAEAATPEQVASFVTGAMGQLNTMYVAPVGYRASDLRVAGSGADALRAYASASQNVFFSNLPADPKDEATYFYDAVTKNDASALKEVTKIGAWYTATGKAYVKIAVPTELAQAHLRTANALISIGSIVSDMALINTDPLKTLLAVGRYDDALKELISSFVEVNKIFVSENVSFAQSETGYRFLQMIQAWATAN